MKRNERIARIARENELRDAMNIIELHGGEFVSNDMFNVDSTSMQTKFMYDGKRYVLTITRDDWRTS